VQAEKKLKETDAIFAQLKEVNEAADRDDKVLRISMDAKAAVKVGLFSRNGKTRVPRNAWDHDFKAICILTPYAFLLPRFDDLSIFIATSSVTSDFIVDMLERLWLNLKGRFPKVKCLVLNQDNGPENQSRRTQFIKRLIEFVDKHRIEVRLAYYPPYHSKYNPVERCWGALEHHWNGEILDEVRTAVEYARTMKWCGVHPMVELVNAKYVKGVRLPAKEMNELEKRLTRDSKLPKWFVTIRPKL
jgi:hypothetical protein